MVELDPTTLISLAETNERMAADYRAEAARLIGEAEFSEGCARRFRERAGADHVDTD